MPEVITCPSELSVPGAPTAPAGWVQASLPRSKTWVRCDLVQNNLAKAFFWIPWLYIYIYIFLDPVSHLGLSMILETYSETGLRTVLVAVDCCLRCLLGPNEFSIMFPSWGILWAHCLQWYFEPVRSSPKEEASETEEQYRKSWLVFIQANHSKSIANPLP